MIHYYDMIRYDMKKANVTVAANYPEVTGPKCWRLSGIGSAFPGVIRRKGQLAVEQGLRNLRRHHRRRLRGMEKPHRSTAAITSIGMRDLGAYRSIIKAVDNTPTTCGLSGEPDQGRLIGRMRLRRRRKRPRPCRSLHDPRRKFAKILTVSSEPLKAAVRNRLVDRQQLRWLNRLVLRQTYLSDNLDI